MLKNFFSKGGHTPGRIFSNHYPKFKIVTRDEFASQEEIKKQRIHEHSPKEKDLEFSSSSLCEKIKESWTTSNEEKILDSNIEELLACLSTYLCAL